jgi:hypothetical protein
MNGAVPGPIVAGEARHQARSFVTVRRAFITVTSPARGLTG